MSNRSRKKASRTRKTGQSVTKPTASIGNAAAAARLEGGLSLPDISSFLPDIGSLIPGTSGFGDLMPDIPGYDDIVEGISALETQVPELSDLIPDIQLPELPGLSDIPGITGVPGYDTIAQGLGTAEQMWDKEGIDAMLDPVGALDRHRARDELSSRFDVMGNDSVRPGKHNRVSEEEFDRIAHTYSDIRLGRGDLTLDTNEMANEHTEKVYRNGCMDRIADIMETSSGRDMVFQLSNNVMKDDAGNARSFMGDVELSGSSISDLGSEKHRHTSVRALYRDGNRNKNLTDDDQTRFSYDNTDAITDAAGGSGDQGELDNTGRFDARRDQSGNRGVGTDTAIWYNPSARVGKCDAADSDVPLAHEMQHALHMTQGTLADGFYEGHGPDGTASVWNNERQAIGLPYAGSNPNDPQLCPENTYRTERNQLGDNYLPRRNFSGPFPGRRPAGRQ